MRPTAWTTRKTSPVHPPWGTAAHGAVNLRPLKRPNQRTPRPRLPSKSDRLQNPLSIAPVGHAHSFRSLLTGEEGADVKPLPRKCRSLNHNDLSLFLPFFFFLTLRGPFQINVHDPSWRPSQVTQILALIIIKTRANAIASPGSV